MIFSDDAVYILRRPFFLQGVSFMDPMAASYYRSILFCDSQDQRPLPPTLILMHAWALKRLQAMGGNGIIAKQSALAVAMTWLSSTNEGREFACEHTTIGELFSPAELDEEQSHPDDETIDWVKLPLETKVVVLIDNKPTPGEYIGRRSSRIDVRIAGERKSFKREQVQLAGA